MKPCLRDWFPVLIQCLSLEAASRARYETGFPRSSSGSRFLRWDVDRRGADFLAAEKSRCMTDSPWSLCLAVSESPARSKVLHQAENQNDKNNIYVNNMQRSLLIQYNTIQYNTKFVKRHVAVASEAFLLSSTIGLALEKAENNVLSKS